MKILRYFVPIAHIYACTALLMWAFGALHLGFAQMDLMATLGTALVLTGAAWVAYAAIAIAVCLAFGFKNPGFAFATAFGVAAGALAIAFTGWLIPGAVLTSGMLAAITFSLVNTFAIWGLAYVSGFTRKGITFWPVR